MNVRTFQVGGVEHPILQAIAPVYLETVSRGAEEIAFEPGEVIFREGDLASRCYLIEEGLVAIETVASDGEAVIIETVGGGEILGWSWLIEPFVCPFRARALEPTRLIALDGAHLVVLAETHHQLGYRLMKRVSTRLIRSLRAARRTLLGRKEAGLLGNLPTPLAAPIGDSPSLDKAMAEHPFMTGMRPEHLRILGADAMAVEFQPGQLILRTGNLANRFYLIERGRVLLTVPRQHESVPIELLGDRDVLGWSWLFEPYRWDLDAQAVAPTRAIFFYGTWLRERCDADQDFGYELMKRVASVVAERLRVTLKRL